MKFRCRGCGHLEYVITPHNLCPGCHMYGPPWQQRWGGLFAAVLLILTLVYVLR